MNFIVGSVGYKLKWTNEKKKYEKKKSPTWNLTTLNTVYVSELISRVQI